MRLRPAVVCFVLGLSTTAAARAATPNGAALLASWKTLDNRPIAPQGEPAQPGAPAPVAPPVADTGATRAPSTGVPQVGSVAAALEVGALVPSGYSYGTAKLSDDFERLTTLGANLNFRVGRWGVPLHLEFGWGEPGLTGRNTADVTGLDVTATSIAAGVGGRYSFAPDARFNPWLGAGFGYRAFALNANGTALVVTTGAEAAIDYSVFYDTWELRPEVGFDLRLSGDFGLGLGLRVPVGRPFGLRYASKINGRETSGDLDTRGSAGWVASPQFVARLVLFP
jgi:hypothetical protein